MDFLNLTNMENRPFLRYIMIGIIAVNALALALLLFGPGRLSAASPQGDREAAAEISDVSPTEDDTESEEERDGGSRRDRQSEEGSDRDDDSDENGQGLFSENREAAEAAGTSATSETADENESSTAPILELNTDSATLKVGAYFNYWDYIEKVEDRDGSDLSRYIHLSNTPDTYTPGEYVVTYRLTSPVTGETSSRELTVTVEY